MLKALTINGVNQPNLMLPEDFKQVTSETHIRNGEDVLVTRYQNSDVVVPNHEHAVLVWGQDHRLLSFNSFVSANHPGRLPRQLQARKIAMATMTALDESYARGLVYMRTDTLSRTFLNDDGDEISIPILWVKFAHSNGSYNWVSVGADGHVVEMERESYWDYFRNRRATEEWNYDDWVLAYEGKGPQPAAPEALA